MDSEALISSELANLRNLFRQWRADHPKGHFPKDLWKQVVQYAQGTDPKKIAKVLGISFSYLRSKIYQYQVDKQESHRQEDAFIEVSMPNEAEGEISSTPMCCKLEDGSGKSMAIQFHGEVQDLVPLVNHFFAGGS